VGVVQNQIGVKSVLKMKCFFVYMVWGILVYIDDYLGFSSHESFQSIATTLIRMLINCRVTLKVSQASFFQANARQLKGFKEKVSPPKHEIDMPSHLDL